MVALPNDRAASTLVGVPASRWEGGARRGPASAARDGAHLRRLGSFELDRALVAHDVDEHKDDVVRQRRRCGRGCAASEWEPDGERDAVPLRKGKEARACVGSTASGSSALSLQGPAYGVLTADDIAWEPASASGARESDHRTAGRSAVAASIVGALSIAGCAQEC